MAFVDRFRHDLARALPLWLSEELVTAEQADRLRAYYRLDDLDATNRGGFASALLVFGALLVGLGVLSFVAANWNVIPPEARALGGLALMVGLDWLGWRWWQRPERRLRGGALLTLGGFLLGGNMALMAQWFQIGGSPAGLFLGWGLGCLAMGWGLAHAPSVAMAAVLCFAAMVSGASWPWLFPWLFALVILPVASWCRSRAAWTVGAIGLAAGLTYLLLPLDPAWWVLGLVAVALGLWSVAELALSRGPWQALRQRLSGEEGPVEAPIAAIVGRPLAVVGLLWLLHAWSFRGLWQEARDESWIGALPAELWTAPSIASAIAMVALGLGAYALAARRAGDPVLHAAMGVCGLGLAAMLFFGLTGMGPSLVTNALLLALELLLAWCGLSRGARGWFWLGFGSLSVQVITRFLEFDTGLLLKSLAFVLWGLALIGVGVWFERLIARQATPVQS